MRGFDVARLRFFGFVACTNVLEQICLCQALKVKNFCMKNEKRTVITVVSIFEGVG